MFIQFLSSRFQQGLALKTISAFWLVFSNSMYYDFQVDTYSKVFKDVFTSCRTGRSIKKIIPPQWEVDRVLQFLKDL